MNIQADVVLGLLLLSCAPQPATVQVAAHETAREAVPQIAPTVDAATASDAGTCRLPDPVLTPGALCTPDDPDFDGRRYAEGVPHCRRHVTAAERDAVAKAYGVAKQDYHLYEFDHRIELAAGGSNARENLWPQILVPDAHDKDRLEEQTFVAMRAGTMTQAEAVNRLLAWTCPK